MSKLKQQFGDWALITGASSGIGEEFAKQIAAAGVNVVLVARRLERLKTLADTLESEYHVRTLIVEQDLAEEDSVRNIAEITADLDVRLIISNAGDGAMGGFLKQDVNKFSSAIKLNVLNPVKMAHHFLGKLYLAQKPGGLLFVSSGVSVAGAPYISDYSASKAYQSNLGQALHHELKPFGIHVTVLMPGPTKTEAYDREDIDFSKMPMPPMSATRVVKLGLRGLIKNKPVVVPGMMNKMMDFMARRVMSRKMASKMFGILMKGLIAPQYRY